MARITKNPEERKAEIMDVALELFASKGFEHTAVSDIVKKIGVAQGTFYYYFKTKEEIMLALINRSLVEHEASVKAIDQNVNMSPFEKVNAILFPQPIHQKVGDFLHHENNAWIHQKFLVKKINEMTPYLSRILAEGTKVGAFKVKHPQETAQFLLTAVNFMLDQGIFAWDDTNLVEKKRAVKEIVENIVLKDTVNE
ncbi:TetR/AcrR family transcriptional regulator [Paenibacillus sp. UMB4589-SE434]|uniref:TetR/AcrR family transcriptional regulator n=1 Tax=Paenibacillus sp. UMB4589-SE434 TaxID=3046314 RepID=UPI0025512D8B|nr:TetR/AcrR family transcriptional regulator [Paenibacillus sp. UMB4589-SE434]MDK8179652.1 TetR/AcrR family transcriptional regulator [Paenibacillus sp. UMB4589-SE434]